MQLALPESWVRLVLGEVIQVRLALPVLLDTTASTERQALLAQRALGQPELRERKDLQEQPAPREQPDQQERQAILVQQGLLVLMVWTVASVLLERRVSRAQLDPLERRAPLALRVLKARQARLERKELRGRRGHRDSTG